jgi:hypothetical protein
MKTVGHALSGLGFRTVKEERDASRGVVYRVAELENPSDLVVEWVMKRHWAMEPGWYTVKSDDLVIVTLGAMRLDFRDSARPSVVLQMGDCILLPAGTVCRGTAVPTTGEPCAFVSVSAARTNGATAEDASSAHTAAHL